MKMDGKDDDDEKSSSLVVTNSMSGGVARAVETTAMEVDGGVPLVLPGKTEAALKKEEEAYIPKWAASARGVDDASSVASQRSWRDDEENNEDGGPYTPTDSLPAFADDSSRALYREIRLLEQKRDEASSATRSNKERIGIIEDHLQNIRSEIDHSNSLVAAKKDELDAEDRLLSLSRRETSQVERDASSLEGEFANQKNLIRALESQASAQQDELDKLRMDLNWNQEELEQYATATAKKEEETLALNRYTLQDELKIKELTLSIEDLTKLSLAKKSMLENEITETRSNQNELEKLNDRFKSRHDDRRQLINQWKDTIESMKNRDAMVNELANQYAGYSEKEDKRKQSLYSNREDYELLEASTPLGDIRERFVTLPNSNVFRMYHARARGTTRNKTSIPRRGFY